MSETLNKEKELTSASFDITKVVNKEGKYTTIPDTKYDVRETFGLDVDWKVPGFKEENSNVPEIDKTYKFDHDTTMAILAGFAHNRRVMVQGYHGTGKSTHIEQVAARLNWPCVRLNMD
ncbi:MAG TPA: cobaltochelatase subunit CobS, partial [Alphaproteobacteria bacterium]|nr:cobaltochelatase subunit CobS [Alphaproteobacteria bacterium]